MKFRILFIVLVHCLLATMSGFATTDMKFDDEIVEQIDSLIENTFHEGITTPSVIVQKDTFVRKSNPKKQVVLQKNDKDKEYEPIDIPKALAQIENNKPLTFNPEINKRFLSANPYFIDLKFYGYASKRPQFKAWTRDDYSKERLKSVLIPGYFKPISFFSAERDIQRLRDITLRKTIAYQPHTVAYMVSELPDVTDLIQFNIISKPIDKTFIRLSDKSDFVHDRIALQSLKFSPWTKRSMVNLQFSQNYISSNWYKGGSDNISILGILNGTFNYDNKKNVQWDNFIEWRAGFHSVDGDTLRTLNTNDDVLRATSKVGIKASGNWFYSSSMDVSTQFFNSYKAINSPEMKVTLFTPVRLNIGVGLDYKYKKLFSLMLSPFSYKFIYASDTINVDKKSFGILPGENVLSQVGSAFKAQLNYSPSRAIQIDSKLSFYTNYEKVEIDWEIITNFRFNRFFSTRLSLNPRYDNTVILPPGEKVKIQFKQLLTFGLSYKLL